MAQYPLVKIDKAPGYVDHFEGWLILTPAESWDGRGVRNCVIGYEDEWGIRQVAVIPERCVTPL